MRTRFGTWNALVGLVLLTAGGGALAASAFEIDTRVDAALDRFVDEVDGGDRFLEAAEGVLVFPKVLKVGVGIGGETGEGALRVDGETVQYYRTSAGSIGLQLGAQSKAIFLLFMSEDSLAQFQTSNGWKIGGDASVNLIKVGAAGAVDTQSIEDPIIGFVLTNKGLMYNLTLEGTKVSPINR